jgi:hypothetical protein
MSLMMMTFGLTPLGTLPVSAAAQAWGAPVAVAGASAVMVVICAIFYFANASLRGIDATAAAALGRPVENVDQPPVLEVLEPLTLSEPVSAAS